MTDAARTITIVEPSSQIGAPAYSAPVATYDPMAMLAAALERGASLDMIDKLISLGERTQAMQARNAFHLAMAAACAEMPVLKKNKTVDFTGKTGIRTYYKHEDLSEVVGTVAPILARHGLYHRFDTRVEQRAVTVTCIISHKDGYQIENTLSGGADESGNKNPVQAITSTITLLSRATLKAALGLAASEDDDGRGGKADDEPPPPMVSADQIETITKAITFKGRTVEALCRHIGVETLADIYASKFSDVMMVIAKIPDASAKEAGNA